MKRLFCILFLFVLFGCSTNKDKALNRFFHRTTTHYNYYYNAREIFNAAVTKVESSQKDDYSELLPLFVYGDESSARSIFPEMDVAIEKSSTAIKKHSMRIKRQERNNWIDDCYLLIGKAYFYKKEYFNAKENFDYLFRSFKDRDTRVQGLIWSARTSMEEKDLGKVDYWMKKLEEENPESDKVKAEMYAVLADYEIKKKNFDRAIEMLEKAVTRTKEKKKRARFTYVLAQLYHQKFEYKKATRAYSEVIKMRPGYEMEFQAKIARARAYDFKSKDVSVVKKEMNKLLRDKKNKEYRDQIYFALAELAFREGDEPLGIEYLRKSAASSTSNIKQKTQSYLRLAKYYYNKPEYRNAHMFYDSTAAVVPKNYEFYDEVMSRKDYLTDLIKNMDIIAREDSLQLIVFDEKKRRKVIGQLIDDAKAEKERKIKELEQDNSGSNNNFFANDNNKNPFNAATATSGKWYFYNPSTMALGVSSFQRVWGKRPLEDDWRRSNKNNATTLQNDTSSNEDGPKIDFDEDRLSEEYYLKDLPLDDSSLIASNKSIEEAMFNVGSIFRENIQDYQAAIETFEKLVSRFPEGELLLPSYYQLYRLALEVDDDKRTAKYRKIIVDNYPDSEYAEIILDPTSAKVVRENKKRVENYYAQAYEYYQNKKYDIVIARCEKAKSIFPENHIASKYDFLKALSIGHSNTVDTFKMALESVIELHPNTEEEAKAKEILNKIMNAPTNENNNGPVYQKNETEQHYFVMMVANSDKQMQMYKAYVANFNNAYFSGKKYSVETIGYDAEFDLLTIKGLENESAAITYFKAFLENKDHLAKLNQKGYNAFIINISNFGEMYKKRDTSGYLTFFLGNYMK